MQLPFQNVLAETFRSDKRFFAKVGGVAFIAAFCTAIAMLRMHLRGKNITMLGAAVGTVGAVTLGALLGLAMSLKDVVAARRRRGEHVNFVLVMLFGWGLFSVLIWVLLIVGGFIALLISGMMFAKRLEGPPQI